MNKTLLQHAETFLSAYYTECQLGCYTDRLSEIAEEIACTGSYTHSQEELEYGAQVAWRNSNRCIGRLFWKSLKVRDLRGLEQVEEVFEALKEHLQLATHGGKIRSFISIFKPQHPAGQSQFRIWNPQLIRYAAYETPQGIIGDPAQLEFTRICQRLGWKGRGTAFDVLPVVIQRNAEEPVLFELPASLVLEVPIVHPRHSWMAELGLKWHALPVISDMVLEIGGIYYPAAPFNGHYMLSEIATRNFGDESRYNLLPEIAQRLGLDTTRHRSLWKDHALLVLNEAVLHSFHSQGVTIVDHHTAAEQFMHFVATEAKAGRKVTADWAWIVPPTAGSTMSLFHRSWDNTVHSPNYLYGPSAWKKPSQPEQGVCPFTATGLA